MRWGPELWMIAFAPVQSKMKPRRGYNTVQGKGRSSDEMLQSDALALPSDPPTQTLKTFAATRSYSSTLRAESVLWKPYVTGEILSSPTAVDLVSEMLEKTSCGASISQLSAKSRLDMPSMEWRAGWLSTITLLVYTMIP